MNSRKLAQLADAIEDAQDQVDRYRLMKKWSLTVLILGILSFLGGWATGVLTGVIGVNAGWLTAGIIAASIVFVIAGGAAFSLVLEEQNPAAKLRAAERAYRDAVMEDVS